MIWWPLIWDINIFLFFHILRDLSIYHLSRNSWYQFMIMFFLLPMKWNSWPNLTIFFIIACLAIHPFKQNEPLCAFFKILQILHFPLSLNGVTQLKKKVKVLQLSMFFVACAHHTDVSTDHAYVMSSIKYQCTFFMQIPSIFRFCWSLTSYTLPTLNSSIW